MTLKRAAEEERNSRHPLRKLTRESVLEIRSLRGKLSQREIAERFGISPQHVSDIMRRVNWDWLK
jgi:transcriptional regulator with XRE-family HTH domain